MIKELHHTAISASDLDQTSGFYCDFLGFSLEWCINRRQSKALEKVTGLKNHYERRK